MNIDTYAKILSRQKQSMTPAMQEAIKEQARLHFICEAKRTRFYELEDQYRDIFSKGVGLFFERYPELHEKLPCREPKAKQIHAIFEGLNTPESDFKNIAQLMKTIPQLARAEEMNVDIGRACFEYFLALSNLTSKISQDRKQFFSSEYLSKMDALADEGVMMYFLETPDFPILNEECDANYILDSFIFGDYMSAKALLESFFNMSQVGDSMRRKQEDIESAICNMMSGYQRTAARNWFSLLESEHKKCADAFEGFWEKTRIFKNGFQRSKKIQELLDNAIDVEWESKAWKKIDAYYQKISGKPIEGVINRNALIHGDYNSNTMDVSSRDAVKIMLMWVNLRLIADHFCNIEELYENRMTMIPYFCTLPDDLAIDIMNRM